MDNKYRISPSQQQKGIKETYFADLPIDSNYLQGDKGLEKPN